MNRFVRKLAVIGFGSLLAGASFGAAWERLPVTSASTTLQAVPFKPWRPTKLPAGTRELLVDARTNPDGSGDLDLFYQLPDGRRLHLWETNRPTAALGGKDPVVAGGNVVALSNGKWIAAPGSSGRVLTLSARLGDVLVSIDLAGDLQELSEIAGHLQ